jgi:hypothetical protein
MKLSSDKIIMVVVWKRKDMDGDAAWHVRQFNSQRAAINFAATQRARTDVEHVRQLDIQ